MHLPFQKVKKTIVWDRYKQTFFFLHRQLTPLLAGNQFIFCKEEVADTFVYCGMLQTS